MSDYNLTIIGDVPCEFLTDSPTVNDSALKAFLLAHAVREMFVEVGGDYALTQISSYLGNVTSTEFGRGGVNVAREVARRTSGLIRRTNENGRNVRRTEFVMAAISQYARFMRLD